MAANPNLLPPPPVREPVVSRDGIVSPVWMTWFTQFYNRVGGAISQNPNDLTILQGYDSSTSLGKKQPGIEIFDAYLTSASARAVKDDSAVFSAATVRPAKDDSSAYNGMNSRGTVSKVAGTSNRITVTSGTTTPVIDIASSYVGQNTITTLGTIGTGVWNGTTIAVANGGTGDTGTAWAAYTPTVSAGSGTFTSVSATGRYKTLGKTVWVEINISITTNGTAANAVIASLPVTAANAKFVLAGREVAVLGKMLQGDIINSAVNVNIYNYDNTYPGANGYNLILSGVYESV